MLTLKNIYQSFPTSSEPILNGIDLHLNNGDYCILLGSNGSGKSTLFKTILGEYTVDNGNIFIDNEDFTHKNRNHTIAAIVQEVNKGTVLELTLLENIVLSLMRIRKAKFAFYRHYEEEAVAQIKAFNLGLEKTLHQPLFRLSGGQRQIIATLMAINSKPKILLCDEHTSALDPRTQQYLMHYTNNAIKENNITTIMITHKLEDAIQYGNRLIMLQQGKIVFDVAGKEKQTLTIAKLLDLFLNEVKHEC